MFQLTFLFKINFSATFKGYIQQKIVKHAWRKILPEAIINTASHNIITGFLKLFKDFFFLLIKDIFPLSRIWKVNIVLQLGK